MTPGDHLTDEEEQGENPRIEPQGFRVEVISGEIQLTALGGLSILAAPTLLRLAAQNAERSLGL